MRMRNTRNTMIQPVIAAAVLGAAAWGLAWPSDVHAAETVLTCAAKTEGGDLIDFTCPLVASGASQVYRLRADFGGSHDDTSTSLKATLDGAPLECDDGSKLASFGEDGDVRLECRFRVNGQKGTTRLLAINLLWSHAQLVRTEFVIE